MGRFTYSTFGLQQVVRQAAHALSSRDRVKDQVQLLLSRLRRDESRIRLLLGRELDGLDLLEIGPGQHCARARYFGRRNRVTGVDLDEVVLGLDPRGLVRAAKSNGVGRVLKTLARKALGVDRAMANAWREALDADELPDPRLLRADVCQRLPFAAASFDVVVSWSVFEHLPDPRRAVENVVSALRPGGVFCLGVHLHTSNSGHHDIRAFTGEGDALPPWAHLRPSTRHLVQPSAVLNGWRLNQWRELLRRVAPDFVEFQERYGEEELRRALTPELRQELAGYDEEELLTTDAFFLWRKPDGRPLPRPTIAEVQAVHAATLAPAAPATAVPIAAPPVEPVRP